MERHNIDKDSEINTDASEHISDRLQKNSSISGKI